MKFSLALLICSAFLSMSFSPAPQSCLIFYNGVYKADYEDEYAVYLRFFEDGTVLHTASVKDESQAFKYLTLENKKNILSGKYSEGNCNIKAKVEGASGKVSFYGKIEGETMFITLKNPANGKALEKTFEYYEMDY